MSLASRRIGNLVLTLQDCFLENPGLALSPWQAEQLCGTDEKTCRAVLNLLADAGVLARTRNGRYVSTSASGREISGTPSRARASTPHAHHPAGMGRLTH